MSNILLLFALITRTISQSIPISTRLGENCHYDIHCQQKDVNSECVFSHDQLYRLTHICSCKLGYQVEIINNTEKCVVGKIPEEEKEGLTAAPIILCFMGCVIIEAFCLLAFRYWKKQRRSRFPRQTLHLEAFPVSNTRVPHAAQTRPLVSFMITSQVDTSVIGTDENLPPPYCETAAVAEASTEEPPTYEEAMKQCADNQSLTDVEQSQGQQKRKMSC